MTNRMPTPPDARKVIVGVDTHKHVHVAVAIDSWGIRLRDHAFVADSGGYQALITWAETHGRIDAFGIEGTGSYGAGLARAVRRAGHRVVEVNRGDRRTRRIAGKSDAVDAETAARSVLAGQSTAIPKTADGARDDAPPQGRAPDGGQSPHLGDDHAEVDRRHRAARAARDPPPARRPGAPQTMPGMALRHDRYADRLGETYPPGARPSLVRSLRRDRGPRPSPGSTHNPDLADAA